MSDTKRNINKGSGETPPAQKARYNSSSEVVPSVPAWPGASEETTSEGNATPVQRGAQTVPGSGSMPTNADLASMMAGLQNAMAGMETRFMTGLQQTVKTEVKTEITKQITPVKSTVETLVKDMATIKEKVRDLESSNAKQSSGGMSRKDEILDVVVKGFKEKKAKDVLMAELENIVKTIMGDAHNVIINVPDDPCNHGILTFEDNSKKLEFYKNAKDKEDVLDDEISFTNKVSWNDRVIEKQMGYIKCHLVKHFNKNLDAVKIYWRKRVVEMEGKKVASYNQETGEWVLYKSAKLVESKVKDSMDLWLSKREKNDPPSESE